VPFDPGLVDRRPLRVRDEWLLNASSAVTRLDIPAIDAENCPPSLAGFHAVVLRNGVANSQSQYFEKKQDVAGCRKTAELWENLRRTDPRSLYNAACYRAVTARVIRARAKSSSDAECERAMTWLQKAATAGYKRVTKIKEDSGLDALHGRSDFQKLVTDLEAATEKN
jgi:hypothetical protein